jgi:DNA-binding PadR family transcriptional regulator
MATKEASKLEPSTRESVERVDTEIKEDISESTEEVTYHAVEKDGVITAIWEMQGKKHLRTIHPLSKEGKKILALFETAS